MDQWLPFLIATISKGINKKVMTLIIHHQCDDLPHSQHKNQSNSDSGHRKIH